MNSQSSQGEVAPIMGAPYLARSVSASPVEGWVSMISRGAGVAFLVLTMILVGMLLSNAL